MDIEKIQKFSLNEFSLRTKETQDKIFNNLDPYNKPFTKTMPHRFIINEGFLLPYKFAKTIFSTSFELGDKGFYLYYPSPTKNERIDRPYRWYIPMNLQSQLSELLWGPYTNILFSPNGMWGIIVDFEIIVVGCNTYFYNALLKTDIDFENEAHSFLDEWRYNKNRFGKSADWLSDFLFHIFGTEKGLSLLKQYDLP